MLRISEGAKRMNLTIKHSEERPDHPTADPHLVLVDLFTTQDGRWDVQDTAYSVPQWAIDAYANADFVERGGATNLFALVLDANNQPVKDITFLFTDLKGSTALYDQIGDPKAYFLVRQHFDTLGNVINRYEGATVKTIGDAVMATFMTPLNAVQAALQMLRDIEAFNHNISDKLVLKIGIHSGHSIVVTLNDRLDYFGQTVNIAARVQGLADAGEIYISEDVYNFPGVRQAIESYNIASEQVGVKGVSEKLQVYKIFTEP